MPKIGGEKQRRKEVMNATLYCILEDGIENVTLDKTAAKAGLSKGVIIYYFQNKKRLLIDTFEYFLTGYFSSVEKYYTDNIENAEPGEMLLIIGRVVLGIENISFGDMQITVEQAGELVTQLYSRVIADDDFKTLFKAMYNGYYQAMEEIFDYAGQNGKWTDIDSGAAVYQLMAMLEGLIIFRAVDYIEDDEAAFRYYSDFIKRLDSGNQG